MTLNYVKKIKSFHRKYSDRCRNFYASTLAGLFTGVIVGIFFSLMTNSEFNRWINLFSYELVAAVIYFLFTLVLIFSLYIVGVIIGKTFTHFAKLSPTKQKQFLISFRVNYFAGIYSASWVTSLFILNGKTLISLTVSALFIFAYVPVEYFTVCTKNEVGLRKNGRARI